MNKQHQCHRTIIPGPPGTGKTHHLINHYLVKEIEEHKTDPDKIGFISFSNAAVNTIKERSIKLFPGKEFKYFKTLHSLGRELLNLDTKSKLLKDEKWNMLYEHPVAKTIANKIKFNPKQIVNDLGMAQHKDPYMQVIDYARAKKLDLKSAVREMKQTSVNYPLLEEFYKVLLQFKKDTGMFEYVDMISKFIEAKILLSLEVIFLDEAQDLNPLQWDMFFQIEETCYRSYIAGDDDQTIYSFQGADASIFVNLQGTIDAKIKSRRVPRTIFNAASKILGYIKPENRRDKQWEPRDAEGKVERLKSLKSLDFLNNEWMILSQCNRYLYSIGKYFEKRFIRYEGKIKGLLPTSLIKLYRIWIRLNNEEFITKEEAILLYRYLRKKDNNVKQKFANKKHLEKYEEYDIYTLKQEHGLLIEGKENWNKLSIPNENKIYIEALLKKGDDLMKDSKIKIMTIHGSKGLESENVVLFLDTTSKFYQAAIKNPDPEHRVWFVGTTRARENLYLTTLFTGLQDMNYARNKLYPYETGRFMNDY